MVSGSAYAQGFPSFASGDSTCYSWNGGNYSAGSFTKCTPVVLVQAKPSPPVAAPVVQQAPAPAPVAPAADKKING